MNGARAAGEGGGARSELLLSRTLDPADYDRFAQELAVVDRCGTAGQPAHRRWEYALALHAIARWTAARRDTPSDPIYDVGGAGSPLCDMLQVWTGGTAAIIDPAHPGSARLDDWCVAGTRLADIVTCVSTITHVGTLDGFLYHLSCLLAPGGLLVLTMDYWTRCGPDTAVHHAQRARIFCPKTYVALRRALAAHGLATFGGLDPTWHGAQVCDYTVASLVLEKRP